jgi:hypothetical protein
MCTATSGLKEIACALRGLEPTWAETLLATYLWPLLTILIAVLVPVLLSQAAARRAVQEAARMAAASRETTLEAVQLQTERETARARADKRRNLVAELLTELEVVELSERGKPAPVTTRKLRHLAARLDLELGLENPFMTAYLGQIPLTALRIFEQDKEGIDGAAAIEEWSTEVEACLRIWAGAELSDDKFGALGRPLQHTFIQQGPRLSDSLKLERWRRLGWNATAD